MNVLEWMPVLYAFWAMILDLTRSRISNRYLIVGWAAGAAATMLYPFPAGQLQFLGGALLPILLLFLLFYFRMMGAGDIKLLSVLGGMLGLRASLSLLICSFVIGAVISVGILTVRGSWFRRFRFFYRYVYNYRVTGVRIPYRPKVVSKDELHFAIPVFIAVLLWKGGVF
ncbi:MAG: prepilin peptidase [Lachnospiraceae bacterium]|nr:prepilin peptidase [Lachnospiraceae bacterium]